ncbi:hypothetical protein F5888DRAFT_1747607 [Russula emetica]|nr:hypothetical protein F5888DRAFT_1747607 [Russula emetica]
MGLEGLEVGWIWRIGGLWGLKYVLIVPLLSAFDCRAAPVLRDPKAFSCATRGSLLVNGYQCHIPSRCRPQRGGNL